MKKFIGSITLPQEMDFIEALEYLKKGACVGIKPIGNANFIVKYKKTHRREDSEELDLCWNRSVKEDGIGSGSMTIDQYTGKWMLVVINVNSLPEEVKLQFVLKNVTEIMKD